MLNLETQSWHEHLSATEKLLIDTAVQLNNSLDQSAYPDYGFVVFPMAKAYEGFLKRFFLELGFITNDVYESRRFRIGRAFNPDVNFKQQDELWLFDDVAEVCGEVLAREMWDAWLECRNQIFHYFPAHYQPLSLPAAEAKLRQMMMVMEGAVRSREQVMSKDLLTNSTTI